MKSTRFIVIAIVMILAFNVHLSAQRNESRNQGGYNIPNLTEDKAKQIHELRIRQIQSSTQHRASMDELRAKKRRISISETPDMIEINSIIDQMESIRADHLKKNEAHRQAVRSILTPEQRAQFDNRHQQRPRSQGQRFKNYQHNRELNGRGPRGR